MRENHVIIEVVDEQGHPVPHGQYGELVITTIGMEAMPLIRYRTGDYTRILSGKCPCKSHTLRLDLLCRKGNFSKILRLDEILFSIDGIVDYKAEEHSHRLKLTVLGTKKMDTARLHEAVPDASIDFRYVSLDDKPMYLGKRFLKV